MSTDRRQWPRGRYPRSPGGAARDREKKSARWRKLSAEIIAANPLCQCPHCQGGKGRFPAKRSQVVHHIRSPIVGDTINKALFYDRHNLLAYAKACHDGPQQSEDRGGAGFLRGCDEFGNPLDHRHSWWEKR